MLFFSTRSQTHSPSESYARWRTLEPLGFAWRQRPPCKRDADPSELKADRDGDHVTNGLGSLRMRQTKTYWHRKTARSEFRAEPQQPGPACGACQCRNLHHYSHAHRSMEAYFAGAASCSAQSGSSRLLRLTAALSPKRLMLRDSPATASAMNISCCQSINSRSCTGCGHQFVHSRCHAFPISRHRGSKETNLHSPVHDLVVSSTTPDRLP